MNARSDLRRLAERVANLEHAFQMLTGGKLGKKEPLEEQVHQVADMVQRWTSHHEMQQVESLDTLAAITRDMADAGFEITQVLPVTVFLDTNRTSDIFAVSKAIRSMLASLELDLFFEASGEWGSWFGRSFARSKRALTSQGVRDTLTRAERALEMQTLLLPQAQIDSLQTQAAAELIHALSDSPNAIVQIGSVLVIKVDGIPIVRNLTQVELSYLEHNRHLYKSPKNALEELGRVSGDPGRFIPPPPGQLGRPEQAQVSDPGAGGGV